MVWLGAASPDDAKFVWSKLFTALSVYAHDDVFARFLQHEMAAWTPELTWREAPPEESASLATADRDGLAYPARQFTRDLVAVLEAKGAVTRRQWTSLLETVLRIGTVSHVVWRRHIHDRTWSCLRASVNGNGPRTVEEARAAMFPSSFSYLSYGDLLPANHQGPRIFVPTGAHRH